VTINSPGTAATKSNGTLRKHPRNHAKYGGRPEESASTGILMSLLRENAYGQRAISEYADKGQITLAPIRSSSA
jgi:hypothetical protein